MKGKKLSELSQEEIAKLTREQLSEALKAENPSLAESLEEAPEPKPAADGGVSEAQLDAALAKQRDALVEEFGPKLTEEQVEDRAQEIVNEREELRDLSDHAKTRLAEVKRNGLPAKYVEEISKNYALYPSGAAPGLQVEERENDEGKTLSKKEVLTEAIKADVEVACELIEAAGGQPPRIEGLGRAAKDPGGDGLKESKTTLKAGSAFREFLHESGDFTGDTEKDGERLGEILSEGAR